MDGEFSRGEEQGERADAVEVAVVAFVAEPIEKIPRVSLGGAGPEHFLPAGGGLEQGGRDSKRMLEAGAEMAAVDADDDPHGLVRGHRIQEVGESAAEPVEIGQVVPLPEALDIFVHSPAQERNEANGLRLFVRSGVKLMERLQPDERELDGVLTVVAL